MASLAWLRFPCSAAAQLTRCCPPALALLPSPCLVVSPHTQPAQVPAFVAKRWKTCCDQSVERGEAVGRPLATLRLVQVGRPCVAAQLLQPAIS